MRRGIPHASRNIDNSNKFASIALPYMLIGPLTKKGSSLLVMSIVGGALIPILMGRIADVSTMALGFIVPLICFAFIFYYGISGYKVRKVASR